MLARIPAGCSYERTRDARRRFTGILGLDSIDRKSRKSGLGLSASSLFSRDWSHCGAKWTFLTRTQLPVVAALLIALSAVATPSFEPMAILVQVACSFSTRLSTL